MVDCWTMRDGWTKWKCTSCLRGFQLGFLRLGAEFNQVIILASWILSLLFVGLDPAVFLVEGKWHLQGSMQELNPFQPFAGPVWQELPEAMQHNNKSRAIQLEWLLKFQGLLGCWTLPFNIIRAISNPRTMWVEPNACFPLSEWWCIAISFFVCF